MPKYDPYICFQNLAEFWAVASRPAKENGLGLSLEMVAERTRLIRSTFNVISETSEAIDKWIELCETHNIIGKKVHDARLASMALAYGISTIITKDNSGFHRFPELSIVELPSR